MLPITLSYVFRETLSGTADDVEGGKLLTQSRPRLPLEHQLCRGSRRSRCLNQAEDALGKARVPGIQRVTTVAYPRPQLYILQGCFSSPRLRISVSRTDITVDPITRRPRELTMRYSCFPHVADLECIRTLNCSRQLAPGARKTAGSAVSRTGTCTLRGSGTGNETRRKSSALRSQCPSLGSHTVS